MRFVEKAAVRPHQCVVFPHLGSNHVDGYFDPGNELTCIDPHPYVSVVAAKEMARMLGYLSPEEHAEAVERAVRAERRVVELEEELARLDAVVDAIDVMESRGFQARRKPGRPRKEVTADV